MLKRSFILDALHLLALCSFAVAQPLYDLLAQNVEFFVAHRMGQLEFFLFCASVSFGLPLYLGAVEALVGLISPRARQALHTVFIAALAGAAILIPFNRIAGLAPHAALGFAALLALGVTVAYQRSQIIQRFCSIASLSAIFFPLYLALLTPISEIAWPASGKLQTGRVEASTPVVLVIFDEFSLTALLNEKREIDAVRFPNFAMLADESWWFRRAISVSPWTNRAVPAILSGIKPHDKEPVSPSVAGHPNTLFTLLGGSYQLNVSETVTQLCPRNACGTSDGQSNDSFNFVIFASDIAIIYLHGVLPAPYASRLLPSLDTGWNGFGGGDQATGNETLKTFMQMFREHVGKDRGNEVSGFLSRIDNADATLDFIHTLLPHNPYIYLPDGKTYSNYPDEGLHRNGKWADNEYLVRQHFQRYLLQVGFTDKILGDLIGRLKQIGKYDRSLIIITADHGRAIEVGRNRRQSSAPDVRHIPLFVKLPRQGERKVSDRPVSNLDILPTIADVLGIKIPWKMNGNSMIATAFPDHGSLDLPAGEQDILTSLPRLTWQGEVFGLGTPLQELRARGRDVELIGKKVSTLSMETANGQASLKMRGWDLLKQVDVNAKTQPVFLRGEVKDLAETEYEGLSLVIALNGVVEAVSPLYSWGQNRSRVSIMLPQAALKSGDNNPQAFIARQGKAGLKLTPISFTASGS